MLLHVLDNVKKKTRHNMYVKAMIKLVINKKKKILPALNVLLVKV